MIFMFALLAIVIGTLMPLQAGLNAELTRHLNHPFLGALISLASGALIVSIFVMFSGYGFSDLKKLISAPPHLMLGGVLGAIFVGSSLFFIPRMGATAMIAAFITGQIIGSLVIDHYGMLSLAPAPVSLQRIIGVFFLFIGLFLVLRKNS